MYAVTVWNSTGTMKGKAMKHLGILAHTMEGAALCVKEFCHEGMRVLGCHQHPDVTLDCIAVGLDPEVVLIDARRDNAHVAPVVPIGVLARYDRPTPSLADYDQLLTGSGT